MTQNPFEVLEIRLGRIEDLLLGLKPSTNYASDSLKDSGGIEIAVEETGLSSHSIYRLVCERKIPHSKKGGRLYFSRKRIREWIGEGERAYQK